MLTRTVRTVLAALALSLVAAPAAQAHQAPTIAVEGYPRNALLWQIKVLAPIGWKPFAYHFCLDATADKIVWLRHRHYHYFVVERCRETLDGYYRSSIRYWYVY